MGKIKDFVLECAEEHMVLNKGVCFDEAWNWATHKSLEELFKTEEGERRRLKCSSEKVLYKEETNDNKD